MEPMKCLMRSRSGFVSNEIFDMGDGYHLIFKEVMPKGHGKRSYFTARLVYGALWVRVWDSLAFDRDKLLTRAVEERAVHRQRVENAAPTCK